MVSKLYLEIVEIVRYYICEFELVIVLKKMVNGCVKAKAKILSKLLRIMEAVPPITANAEFRNGSTANFTTIKNIPFSAQLNWISLP